MESPSPFAGALRRGKGVSAVCLPQKQPLQLQGEEWAGDSAVTFLLVLNLGKQQAELETPPTTAGAPTPDLTD